MPEKLSDFWDQKVVKSDKHFVETLSQEKINRMKSRVDELLFSQLDFSKIQTVLDWGCGGGLFAKILSEKTKVIIADISQESINKTRSYTGKDLPAILIPEKLSDIQIPEKNIDLIFCHTVIHHFPSYEYWLEVFDIWTQKIRPNYFALQIKIEDKTIARENYFS
jgi:2-polyprenyl-3-methyl-5-hydroxy-6-metoxy-1,4-benzoquinol methylase